MAFHLACPLTCRKICYCTFGDPSPLQTRDAKQGPLFIATALKKLLASPYVAFGGEGTIDVLVPCLPKDVKNKHQKVNLEGQVGRDNTEDGPHSKRTAIGRKMIVASTDAAEVATKAEHAKKKAVDGTKLRVTLRNPGAEGASKTNVKKSGASRPDELDGAVGLVRRGPRDVEDLHQPLLPQVVCGLCSSAEIIGREREKRMLSCRGCTKKYHRKCVKHWAEFRDLFNWQSWVCGFCRSCEVCRRTGEANKLMFCKRCDVALHVYCQQPPLKHVPKGPYLCPKHTRCHSCASNVPGSGVSSKWFMSYTTCDACGRLFVKDKYCPVCLKVYRDSEATPMVCCDSCEHWVHCRCDGISDEKYNQFQTDDNLRYKCPACRGDCHKVTGLDDAVRELWKRRDKTDAQQIAKLGAAAGLPPAEENFCLSSDDEKQHPAATQASGLPRKVSESSIDTRVKSKRDSAFARPTEKPEDVARKKIVVKRINLKRPKNMEVDTEESNEEQNFPGDPVKYSFASTISKDYHPAGAPKQRIRFVDIGRSRGNVS